MKTGSRAALIRSTARMMPELKKLLHLDSLREVVEMLCQDADSFHRHICNLTPHQADREAAGEVWVRFNSTAQALGLSTEELAELCEGEPGGVTS